MRLSASLYMDDGCRSSSKAATQNPLLLTGLGFDDDRFSELMFGVGFKSDSTHSQFVFASTRDVVTRSEHKGGEEESKVRFPPHTPTAMRYLQNIGAPISR
jgi:hypothetical protein